MNLTENEINEYIKSQKNNPKFNGEKISDGWHSFEELYEFRKIYNAALFNLWALHFGNKVFDTADGVAVNTKYSVHKSWKHEDGEWCFGNEKKWFIVSAMLPTGLISNHYKAKDWDLFKIPEVKKALFKFDGHTSADVLTRLSGL